MILDGRKIRDIILDEVKDEVSKLKCKPKLVVIQVGNDDASRVYVNQKQKMCDDVGYDFEYINLEDDVDTEDVVKLVDKLNKEDSVNGIIVQLPMPNNIDSNKVVNMISSVKDVDGLTDFNKGRLFCGESRLSSCTASGIIELLDRYNISVNGKNVVIVNRSNIVGKPLSMMMLNRDATVSVCHSKTKNLSEYTKNADILVSAVGKPNFITSDMISEDTVVVDGGIVKIGNRICGDVDFGSVKDKVKYITPVPGGVGPMTVAMLAKNVLKVYKMQNENNIK